MLVLNLKQQQIKDQYMESRGSLPQTDRSIQNSQKEIQNSSEAELCFGFQISTSSICDLFEQVAQQLGFEMIEKEQHHSTAIKQVKRSLLQIIDCFNWISEGNMTAIKLTIHTSEKNSTRVAKLKGLVGSRKEVKQFLDLFRKMSEVLIKEQPHHLEESEQMLDEPENPFHLQACAAYMFHKILSNEQYGIGNILSRSLKDYSNTFSDVEKSVKQIPLPMKNAMITVRQIVDNLYKDFNLGRKQMEKIMPYCRISVEKYLFDKIDNIITPIYHHRASEQTTIFEEKRERIFAMKKLKDIFADINLESHNWIFEESIGDPQAKMQTVLTRKQVRSITKYRKACEQLQKMSFVTNPREKMKHCQIAYSVLKTLVYESSNKKHELTNMEDIIPIFIIVILLCEVKELKAQLDLIVDFIEFDNCDLESERRLLLNLTESFNFVQRDWKA